MIFFYQRAKRVDTFWKLNKFYFNYFYRGEKIGILFWKIIIYFKYAAPIKNKHIQPYPFQSAVIDSCSVYSLYRK